MTVVFELQGCVITLPPPDHWPRDREAVEGLRDMTAEQCEAILRDVDTRQMTAPLDTNEGGK